MIALLAQLTTNQKTSNRIIDDAFVLSQRTRESIDSLWPSVLQGQLFWGVSQAGALIAALFIAWWLVLWIKKNVNSEYPVGPDSYGPMLLALGDFWERTHGLNWLDEDVPFR